jgi:predicted acetyltransferase
MNTESLKIVRFDEINEQIFITYIQEWEENNEKAIPSVTNRRDRRFSEIAEQWALDETKEAYQLGFVPATLYFLVDGSKRIIGALHLRHEINDKLLLNGGHIGYGIRPSERKKGYATIMLNKFLKEMQVRQFKRVLLTCNDDNIASAKTIEKCNGVLWDKIEYEGKLQRRYWIEINE